MRLPPTLVQLTGEVATGSEDPLLRQGLPRSVDNMSPDNRAIRTLSSLPIAPGVTAHSIIAVRGTGPAEEGSDGLVTYRSAHLAGAASERIVRSGYNPRTGVGGATRQSWSPYAQWGSTPPSPSAGRAGSRSRR